MSFSVLRRLATTCRSTSLIYSRRTFTTSSPNFDEASSSTTTASAESPRIVTLIPGK